MCSEMKNVNRLFGATQVGGRFADHPSGYVLLYFIIKGGPTGRSSCHDFHASRIAAIMLYLRVIQDNITSGSQFWNGLNSFCQECVNYVLPHKNMSATQKSPKGLLCPWTKQEKSLHAQEAKEEAKPETKQEATLKQSKKQRKQQSKQQSQHPSKKQKKTLLFQERTFPICARVFSK